MANQSYGYGPPGAAGTYGQYAVGGVPGQYSGVMMPGQYPGGGLTGQFSGGGMPGQFSGGGMPGQFPGGGIPVQFPGGVIPVQYLVGSMPGHYPGGGVAGYGQPASMDPNVTQWFVSVDTDRSGRISVLELQQALTNSNWTQFDVNTCRLMIAMFDRDFSGTIDLNEFQALWMYLQQWRAVFELYDRNRSGAIEHTELQAAFQQMGFNLSPNFVNVAVGRFDVEQRRQLTLDHFIQSCVLLKTATELFRQKDAAMTGSLRIDYDDFMCSTMIVKP